MSETKAELEERVALLEQEKAELQEKVDQLEHTAEEGLSLTETRNRRQRPVRPTGPDGQPQLTEGERQALESEGVTVSPFTGEQLNALDEGVTPANPRARRAAERAHQRPQEVTDPNAWPVAGPPPAEGGDTDPLHDN
jgi:hypothetical protein